MTLADIGSSVPRDSGPYEFFAPACNERASQRAGTSCCEHRQFPSIGHGLVPGDSLVRRSVRREHRRAWKPPSEHLPQGVTERQPKPGSRG